MLLFAAAFYLAVWVGGAVALIQLAFKMISGKSIPRLAVFGANLGTYLGQILAFETFASERRPWPLTSFPAATNAPRRGACRPQQPANRTRVVKTARRQTQDDKK